MPMVLMLVKKNQAIVIFITVNGLLVEESLSDGISLEINNSNTYTVPTGKRLYITNYYGPSASLAVWGLDILLMI